MDRGATVELSGTWLAAPSDEDLRRAFARPAFADAAWQPVPVPGHWRTAPAFADSDGPLLYRRRFATSTPEPGRRRWLVLDGLLYQGDVWLDGAYLGDTEGYFAPHAFEVTEPLAAADEHVLAVEVSCPPQPDGRAKRNLTGVLQEGGRWNPGGIWRSVRVEETGPVRIRTLRVVCRDATPERATVAVRASLDADRARRVRIRTSVGDHDHESIRPLAEGANWVEWEVAVDEPALWWPRALGEQRLVEASVEVLLPDEGGALSHRRRRRVGLRRTEWRGWTLHVNGERLFLKGAGYGPTRLALATATPEEVAADVDLAVGAGLDLLRVHGHVARPELYDAADEAGLLLWQDLPLARGYARSVRRQAVEQARRVVDVLGHHPSVVLWCAHDEPPAADVRGDGRGPGRVARYALGLQLPSWNRTVLDRSVARALERADGSRRVLPHSGVPSAPWARTRDAHLFLGWDEGDERDLPRLAGTVPRLVRFVSAFGAQAVPHTADFAEPWRWPDLDWDHLERDHGLERARLERQVPAAAHATFSAWRDATQAYQAVLVRRHVEELRRRRFRPVGGFAQFLLADPTPSVGWGVVDHARVPKAGYAALRAACAPVIVVADRLPAGVRPGEALALDVHVVSDLRHALERAEVTARLTWPGGGHVWRWAGRVPADDCVRVGIVQVVVPDVDGGLRLGLHLDADGVEADNADTTRISPT